MLNKLFQFNQSIAKEEFKEINQLYSPHCKIVNVFKNRPDLIQGDSLEIPDLSKSFLSKNTIRSIIIIFYYLIQ